MLQDSIAINMSVLVGVQDILGAAQSDYSIE